MINKKYAYVFVEPRITRRVLQYLTDSPGVPHILIAGTGIFCDSRIYKHIETFLVYHGRLDALVWMSDHE